MSRITRMQQRAAYEDGKPIWRGAFQARRQLATGETVWETWTRVARLGGANFDCAFREYDAAQDEATAGATFERACDDAAAR